MYSESEMMILKMVCTIMYSESEMMILKMVMSQ